MNQKKANNNSDEEKKQKGAPDIIELIEGISEEVADLQKAKTLTEIQSEVTEWAKKRFWIVTFVALFIGFFGINSLIRSTINSRLDPKLERASDKILNAEMAADRAAKITSEAEDLIKSANRQLKSYSQDIESLQVSATELTDQFRKIRSNLEGQTSNLRASSELGLSEVRARIEQLENLVKELAGKSQDAESSLRLYESKIEGLKIRQETINKAFSENSDFKVMIESRSGNEKLADKIQSALSRNGFQVLLREPYEITEGETYIETFRSLIQGPTIIMGRDSEGKAEEFRKVLSEILPEKEFTILQRPREYQIMPEKAFLVWIDKFPMHIRKP